MGGMVSAAPYSFLPLLLSIGRFGWGETHSCPVYGTGRIHCEKTLSVNYHRAINRAEKDPQDRHPFNSQAFFRSGGSSKRESCMPLPIENVGSDAHWNQKQVIKHLF